MFNYNKSSTISLQVSMVINEIFVLADDALVQHLKWRKERRRKKKELLFSI
jgi:hypothetical protein